MPPALRQILDNFDTFVVDSVPKAAAFIGTTGPTLKQRIDRGLGAAEVVPVTERARVRFTPRALLQNLIYDRTARFGVPLAQDQIWRAVEEIRASMREGRLNGLYLVVYDLGADRVWFLCDRDEVAKHLDDDIAVIALGAHAGRLASLLYKRCCD